MQRIPSLVRGLALLAGIAVLALHCSPARLAPLVPSRSYSGELKEILTENEGKVLLLLLGRDDCPGTRKAMTVLSAYAAAKPADATIVRMDVPLPGESLKPAPEWDYPFDRVLDEGRRAAEQLDFFFYPTLYVFDREGQLRFEGGCDKERMASMVREILAEQPGQEKKIYTVPKPAVGQAAPAFAATTLTSEALTLESLRGKRAAMLVFARTSCEYTLEALPDLMQVADSFAAKDVATVIVNQGQQPRDIRPVYEKHTPGIPVVWDRSGEVSRSYGVDVTPYLYLLDSGGKIVQRRSFTAAAAANALNAHLGLAPERTRYQSKGAG